MRLGRLTVYLILLAPVFGTGIPVFGASDPHALFEEAKTLFDAAEEYQAEHASERAEISTRFRATAEAYVAAWKAGATSTEVFTNAANSYYFAGDTGEAVLFWRRALSLDPNNAGARKALRRVRETLPVRRKTSAVNSLADSLFFWHDERFFFVRAWVFYYFFPAAWIFFAVEIARTRWRWIHVLLAPVAPFALLAAALSYLFRLRRPYATVGVLCLIPALSVLGSLVIEATENKARREAVVLVEVQGRNGDGASYSASHNRPFPPGTEAEILDRRETNDAETWIHVALLDGTRSWIPEQTVEAVVVAE